MGENLVLGWGTVGNGTLEGAALVAPELGESQPQILGEWAANTFPSLASLNRKGEDEETAGEEGAVPAWPYIPPQHLSSY